MKIPKFTPRDLVLVNWLDAGSHDAWSEAHEAQNMDGDFPCTTVGFVVKQNRRNIFVAGSCAPKSEENSGDAYCSIMVIPIGMITSVELLRAASPPEAASG